MIKASFAFDRSFVASFKKQSIQRLERAALVATHKASLDAKREVRAAFGSAGLGGLQNAIIQFSDLEKGKVYRRGKDGFSASGGLAINTTNERTVGAIISYTEGAEIAPIKGRWLWFSTNEIPRKVGRQRMTPELYKKSGLEQSMGELVYVRGINGRPLLVIKNAAVGGPRGLVGKRNKSGGLRKGFQEKAFVVAFIGIPRTSRQRRVDVLQIVQANANRVGDLINIEMQKGS